MRSVDQVAKDYDLTLVQAQALRMWLESEGLTPWPTYEQAVQDTRVWNHRGHVIDALRLDGASWTQIQRHLFLASFA